MCCQWVSRRTISVKRDVPDHFRCVKRPDGAFDIKKNGEHLLTCTGSEDDARNIIKLLNSDRRETK